VTQVSDEGDVHSILTDAWEGLHEATDEASFRGWPSDREAVQNGHLGLSRRVNAGRLPTPR
jgi:hypothetical protein